jgi:hypothetical protein
VLQHLRAKSHAVSLRVSPEDSFLSVQELSVDDALRLVSSELPLLFEARAGLVCLRG